MKPFFIALFFCLFTPILSGQCPIFLADSEGILCDSEGVLWEGNETNCDIGKTKHPLSIFPNPTIDYFQVVGIDGDTEGYLFDTQGRLVRKIIVTTMIDISDLPNALYFIKINNQTFKIVKQE